MKICCKGDIFEGVTAVIKGGKLTRATALKDKETLTRHIFDVSTFTDDSLKRPEKDASYTYAHGSIADDGAFDNLLTFVVSRELGLEEKAWKFAAKARAYDDAVRQAVKPTKPGVSINGSWGQVLHLTFRNLEE